MENDSKTISANEINKYTYCSYQWYYERCYGTKKLRQLAKERNERLGLEDATTSNFHKGLRHHDRYHLRYRWKRILWGILYILAGLLLAYGILAVIHYG